MDVDKMTDDELNNICFTMRGSFVLLCVEIAEQEEKREVPKEECGLLEKFWDFLQSRHGKNGSITVEMLCIEYSNFFGKTLHYRISAFLEKVADNFDGYISLYP
jgi:hypothetical protein